MFVLKLKKELLVAMKNKDHVKRDWIRSVIAEFERQTKKSFTDDEIIKVIKSMTKLEKERMEVVNETESPYLDYLNTFMPEQVSNGDIVEWIEGNIDFSQYKNRMQAMGVVMKHFGSTVDGKVVRDIIGQL